MKKLALGLVGIISAALLSGCIEQHQSGFLLARDVKMLLPVHLTSRRDKWYAVIDL